MVTDLVHIIVFEMLLRTSNIFILDIYTSITLYLYFTYLYICTLKVKHLSNVKIDNLYVKFLFASCLYFLVVVGWKNQCQ